MNEKQESEYNVDMEAIKQAVRAILVAVGEDPDRPGLQATPHRVAKMYAAANSVSASESLKRFNQLDWR